MMPDALPSTAAAAAGARLFGQGRELCPHLYMTEYVVRAPDSPFLVQRTRQQRGHLQRVRADFGHLPIVQIPSFPEEVRGLERLRAVGRWLCPVRDATAGAA